MEGQITGYHSNRRVPDRYIPEGTIMALHEKLVVKEKRHSRREEDHKASIHMLAGVLSQNGMEYDELEAKI